MPLRRSRGQLVLLAGNFAYKVGVSRAALRRIAAEARNNELAQRSFMWRDLVVPASRFGCVLLSRRYPPALPEHEDAVEAFIDQRLVALAEGARRPASELVDVAYLDALQAIGLEGEIVGQLCDRLASFDIPATASHGDFFSDNIIWRGEKIALIDWDSYRQESSFLFDAVHYYINRRQIELHGKSWTFMVFEDFESCPEIPPVLNRLAVSARAGALGYALDRMSREIAQEGGVAWLSPWKLEKYLTLSRKLADLAG